MNHIYKSVWHSERGTYVAASENTKVRGKSSTSSKARRCMSSLTVVGATIAAVLSFLLPTSAAQSQLPSDENGHVNIGGSLNSVGGFGDYAGINNIAIGDFNVLERDYSIGIGYGNSGLPGAVVLTENLGMVTYTEALANIDSGVWYLDPENDRRVLDADGNYLFDMSELLDWDVDEEGNLVNSDVTGRYTTGYASVAMGVGNHAYGYQSVGIGSYNVVGGENSVSLGVKNWSTGDENVVLGSGNVLTGDQSIAIGTNNSVSGAQSIAIGVGHTITGNNSGAFGDPNIVNGNNSYAVGNNNTIESDDSFVMGSGVTIAQDHHKAVALGAGTAVNVEGGVALGAGSVANRAAGASGYIPAGATASQQAAIEATTSTLAGVSVGDADNEVFRQIHGVAAGTEDSDAVNVSQLKGVENIANAGWNVKSNDGSSFANIGPDGDVNFEGDDNITIVQTGGDDNATLQVTLEKDIKVDSVNAGGTLINSNGLSFVDPISDVSLPNTVAVKSDGIDMGDNRITNVADGVNRDDAVNKGQLDDTRDELIAKGLNFVGDDGQTVHRDLGQTLSITGGATGNLTSGNIGVVEDGSGGLSVQLAENIDLGSNGSVTMGDTTVNSSGIAIYNSSTGNTVSLSKDGLDNGGNRIINVAPGIDGTDAVNVDQLTAVNNNLQQQIDGNRRDIKRNRDRANAGIAAAMATAGLPQAYLPGKSMVAAAGGVWRGESGFAIGVSTVSDNGKWVLKGSANTSGRGGAGGTIGVGYQW